MVRSGKRIVRAIGYDAGERRRVVKAIGLDAGEGVRVRWLDAGEGVRIRANESPDFLAFTPSHCRF